MKYQNPTAGMLATLLACADRPGDNRLNQHLKPEEVGETIRVAIDCLEGERVALHEAQRASLFTRQENEALRHLLTQALQHATDSAHGVPRLPLWLIRDIRIALEKA